MAIQADNILDLIAFTLKDLNEGSWTDLMSPYQDHPFVDAIMDSKRATFTSGTGIQWNIGTANNGAAKMVGLWGTDAVSAVDVGKQGYLPLRHCTTNYGIDEREIAMNKGSRQILDLVKVGEATANMALVELLERQGWGKPSTSSDDLSLHGVQYWITPSTTQGFNGGNPYGFTAGRGGVSTTDVPAWANYTDSYKDVSRTDLIRRMRRAAYMTKFKSSKMVNQVSRYSLGKGRGIYTTYFVVGRLEEELERRNDNLGNDVASKDGEVMFRGNSVTPVPIFDTIMASVAFDNSAYAAGTQTAPMNPVYGINWDSARITFLESFYMKRFGPVRVPNQHNVIQTHIDNTLNMYFFNLRDQWLMTQ